MKNSTFSYTSITLHDAYKQKRHALLPLLKEEKDEQKKKKIQLALLSIDLCVQIFNDANRAFPVIDKEIVEQSQQSIPLVENRHELLERLKTSLSIIETYNKDIFEGKMYYSKELSLSKSASLPVEIVSSILKENAFLLTHILHLLYSAKDNKEAFRQISAYIQYLIGLNVIEPVSSKESSYMEILEQREKYKTEKEVKNELETFIFNSHHFCLVTLLFVKHWMGFKEYGLEDAEKDLNDKINVILKQRKNTPIK